MPPKSPESPQKPYVPPVGPGSKSVPPSGDWREIDPALVREITRPVHQATAQNIGRIAL